jgi:hypothetical protein
MRYLKLIFIMNAGKFFTWARMLLLAGLVGTGCGKSDGKVDATSFDKAAPEIRSDWDAAIAADKANDYFNASMNYSKVMRQEAKLTSQQFDSALAASRALSERLTTAAAKGDVAAKAALAKLMAAQSR